MMSFSEQRGEGGDASIAPRLPIFVRFRDLRNSGIADNWTQLLRMVDHDGFPCGKLLSPNVRVWDINEIRQWLEARPTARKIVATRRRAEASGAST
jgi:hypothetical protein